MKIKYQFVNENVEVDVEEKWGTVLLDLERQEYNNQQKETRRHLSLDGMDYEGDLFIDHTAEVSAVLAKADDVKTLQKAIDSLLPQQRELLRRVLIHKERMADIAREQGVSKAALTSRMQKIFVQLKKSIRAGA